MSIKRGFPKGKGYLNTYINGELVHVTYEWDETFEEVEILSIEYKGTEVLPLISDEQFESVRLAVYAREWEDID